jgi:hypothetical protein
MGKKPKYKLPTQKRLGFFADRLWGRTVLSDWNHTCAVCGKGATDAHHIVPRQHYATRFDLLNGIGLCSRCHIWSPESPHQNAVLWLEWLAEFQPELHHRYIDNPRPVFGGTVNVGFYCEVIESFREYFEPGEFADLVGIKFSAWLEEQK